MPNFFTVSLVLGFVITLGGELLIRKRLRRIASARKLIVRHLDRRGGRVDADLGCRIIEHPCESGVPTGDLQWKAARSLIGEGFVKEDLIWPAFISKNAFMKGLRPIRRYLTLTPAGRQWLESLEPVPPPAAYLING